MSDTPDYINPNRKKVSDIDIPALHKAIREVQRQRRAEDRESLNKALASGVRTGPKH